MERLRYQGFVIRQLEIWGGAALLILISSVGQGLTDVQKQMVAPPIDRQALIQKYSLSRLWTFEDSRNFEDDSVLGSGRSTDRGVSLINQSFNVRTRTCGRKSFTYFENGMIQSDESLLIEDVLNEVKPKDLEQNMVTVKKGWNFLRANFPNLVPSSEAFQPAISDKVKPLIATKESARSQIQQSSSLVEVKRSPRTGEMIVNSSDYTIGGWFKPGSLVNGSSGNGVLFRKKFVDTKEQNPATIEWTVFYHGNVIYFQSFRDGGQQTTNKFLKIEDAVRFRNSHADFYAAKDYYDDVVTKPVVGKIIIDERGTSAPKAVPIARIFLDDPTLPANKKPVPPGPPTPPPPGPPPYPPPPPPPIPIPDRPIPLPPYPYPVPVPPGGSKVHTLDFDMKKFWWAAQLGSCYGCESNGQHRDAWYYLSLSVHVNDPLGPYADLTIIMDPNEKIFGKRATFARNVRTARWELNRHDHSREILNPFINNANYEKTCPGKTSCMKSILEIGSIDQNNGYSGYMRGVFLSKRALKQTEVLDMAAQFYPDDFEQCTYMQKRK